MAPAMGFFRPVSGASTRATEYNDNIVHSPLQAFQTPVPARVAPSLGLTPTYSSGRGGHTFPGAHPAPSAVQLDSHYLHQIFSGLSRPPFEDPARAVEPITHGVVRIRNIPYSLTVSEVLQFITRHTHPNTLLVPHQHGYPVHIIMERATGKTMDCFVELLSPQIAAVAVQRSEILTQPTKPTRMGTRHISLELSSQGELMQEMFPRARCVSWDTGTPELLANNDPYSTGFKGLLTPEELAGMVRHAEFPQRSPFSAKCLNRTYESMVSLLYKFPWRSTLYYDLATRDAIFKAYMSQLRVLVNKVAPPMSNVEFISSHKTNRATQNNREVGLDTKLLMDLIFAGMNCIGFSEQQKLAIVENSGDFGRGLPISPHARFWPFESLSLNRMIDHVEVGVWLKLLGVGYEECQRNDDWAIGRDPNQQFVHFDRDLSGNLKVSPTATGAEISWYDYNLIEHSLMMRLLERGRNIVMLEMDLGMGRSPAINPYIEPIPRYMSPFIGHEQPYLTSPPQHQVHLDRASGYGVQDKTPRAHQPEMVVTGPMTAHQPSINLKQSQKGMHQAIQSGPTSPLFEPFSGQIAPTLMLYQQQHPGGGATSNMGGRPGAAVSSVQQQRQSLSSIFIPPRPGYAPVAIRSPDDVSRSATATSSTPGPTPATTTGSSVSTSTLNTKETSSTKDKFQPDTWNRSITTPKDMKSELISTSTKITPLEPSTSTFRYGAIGTPPKPLTSPSPSPSKRTSILGHPSPSHRFSPSSINRAKTFSALKIHSPVREEPELEHEQTHHHTFPGHQQQQNQFYDRPKTAEMSSDEDYDGGVAMKSTAKPQISFGTNLARNLPFLVTDNTPHSRSGIGMAGGNGQESDAYANPIPSPFNTEKF